MRIRSHLLLLAAGAMLPVLAFAVLVSVILVRQDNATVQRGALEFQVCRSLLHFLLKLAQ